MQFFSHFKFQIHHSSRSTGKIYTTLHTFTQIYLVLGANTTLGSADWATMLPVNQLFLYFTAPNKKLDSSWCGRHCFSVDIVTVGVQRSWTLDWAGTMCDSHPSNPDKWGTVKHWQSIYQLPRWETDRSRQCIDSDLQSEHKTQVFQTYMEPLLETSGGEAAWITKITFTTDKKIFIRRRGLPAKNKWKSICLFLWLSLP